MMEEIILKFNPKFQREIFQRVIEKYKGSINASKFLKIPASSIRGYKNIYFNYVPRKIINLMVNFEIINVGEVEKNLILSLDKSELINNNLNTGRLKRIQNLKNLRKNIPKISKLIQNNKLDLHEWFKFYKKLLDSGFRKTSHEVLGKNIVVKYNNFNRRVVKEFNITLPKEIILNDEFVYFFGLWCGDRAGGKRLGVCNQNKQILNFINYFLKKHNQKIEKILYISPNLKEPNLNYDKKYYTRDRKSVV